MNTPKMYSRPAKKREGAAMLIVLMVLIMATATATFAIHATTVEIRGAGHSRQAMQTAYVAEGGAYASLAAIDSMGAAAAYQQYNNTLVGAGMRVSPTWPPSRQQTKLLRIDLDDYVGGPSVVSPPFEMDYARGPSLGPRTNVVPSFTVDGTDLYRHFPMQAGRDVTGGNEMYYVRINMTSRGAMAPPVDAPSRPGDSRSFNQSSINARANTEVGPFVGG